MTAETRGTLCASLPRPPQRRDGEQPGPASRELRGRVGCRLSQGGGQKAELEDSIATAE